MEWFVKFGMERLGTEFSCFILFQAYYFYLVLILSRLWFGVLDWCGLGCGIVISFFFLIGPLYIRMTQGKNSAFFVHISALLIKYDTVKCKVSNVIPSLWSVQNNVHNHHNIYQWIVRQPKKRKPKILVAAINKSYHLKRYVDKPSKPKHFTKLGFCSNISRIQVKDTRSVTATTLNHSYDDIQLQLL